MHRSFSSVCRSILADAASRIDTPAVSAASGSTIATPDTLPPPPPAGWSRPLRCARCPSSHPTPLKKSARPRWQPRQMREHRASPPQSPRRPLLSRATMHGSAVQRCGVPSRQPLEAGTGSGRLRTLSISERCGVSALRPVVSGGQPGLADCRVRSVLQLQRRHGLCGVPSQMGRRRPSPSTAR